MRLPSEFVVTYETVLFFPKYDRLGKLFTVGLDNNGLFIVGMSPYELMDSNLKYYGSSLRGARDGARMILGEISMPPIVINDWLEIYWFPSCSPTRDDCVWFALHHIADYISVGKKKTLITFKNGSTFTVDISINSFEKRIQQAYKLKFKMEERTKGSFIRVAESVVKYHVNQGSKAVNYSTKR